MSEVVMIRTGTANLASVQESAADAVEAERLVLPGVGAFGAVIQRIDALRLRPVLVDRINAGLPTLAICLGLQTLAAASQESPGIDGLGVIPATVTALPPGVRRPQLGWNRVTVENGCKLLRDGEAYFANSFKLDAVPEGWRGATTDHGGVFVAAVERGAVLACQFHPELSGAWGQALIERWLGAA
jgi:imidazole glycerol phosphate synthase glutamine amidotransferase subunit